jgi:hypothetical protein
MTGRPVDRATGVVGGAVTGLPLLWLRIEGAAILAAGAGLYLNLGGLPIAIVPLILAVDISAAGYLAGPRTGAIVYNLFHNLAIGTVALGLAWWLGSTALGLTGAVLVAHAGMDRALGYGLKYPTAFADTHLGRLGRRSRVPAGHA